jgi:RNA polymerase sigma factor (sigma-70 family)
MEPDDGFADWYGAQHDGVVRALAAVVGDVDAAREATDEAFVRALERWGQVSGMASPAGWVYRVGLNAAHRRARRAAVERRLLGRQNPREAVWSDPVDAELWAAVRRLPARQRVAVALRYIADLPEPVIAEVLGVASGTVSATLHAARKRLAGELAGEEVEAGHD